MDGLTIAGPDGEVQLGARPIGQLVALAGDKALILDGGRTPLVADFATGGLGPLGRNSHGEDPEFGLPAGLVRIPAGEAYVSDPTKERFVVVGRDGTFDGYLPFERSAGVADLLMREVPLSDGMGRWYLEDNPWAASTSIPIVRWEPASETREIVGYRNDARGRSVPAVAMALPTAAPAALATAEMFAGDELWTVDRSGRIYRVSPKPYRVSASYSADQVVTGPVVEYDRVPVTDEEDAALRERLGKIPDSSRSPEAPDRELGGTGSPDFRPPPNKPPFPSTAVIGQGPDGLLWVPRTVPIGEPARCDRFDAKGNPAAPMLFDPDARVVGYGDDVVYLVVSIRTGASVVRRYRIPAST